jgi:Ribonuclease G/E
MPIARILRETAIGETRWLALDTAGRPVALHLERSSDREARAYLGDVFDGRLRAVHPRQGGGFVELPSGDNAFIRLDDGHGLTEGQSLRVEVVAEARRDKLARDRDARWRKALPGAGSLSVEDVSVGDAEMTAAWDEALSGSVTLPGGGTLHIQPTNALVAVDLDTSGRNDPGRASARALRINSEAAQELARQASLRNLGGAMVLDCVSPINRESGIKVRDTFLSAFKALSQRNVRALAPSAFGLMEASIAWGAAPLGDRLVRSDGEPTDETLCLESLRQLQREARSQPMARLTLALPRRAFDWMIASRLDLQGQLDEIYGARLTVLQHDHSKPDIFQT